MTRVYVPATIPALTAYVRSGTVPSTAERFVAAQESEEAEYDALSAAAESAEGLLEGPGRRVVVVAEVEDEDAAFGLDAVVAVHADTEDVDPGEQHLPDLGWYATQEIEALLES